MEIFNLRKEEEKKKKTCLTALFKVLSTSAARFMGCTLKTSLDGTKPVLTGPSEAVFMLNI